MEDVDREISEMKLSLNARARIVAESYLVGPYPLCLDKGLCSRTDPPFSFSLRVPSFEFGPAFTRNVHYNCFSSMSSKGSA